MSNAVSKVRDLNNSSFVDLDFVSDVIFDMLEDKEIVYNGVSLDSCDLDEGLEFLIEEIKNIFEIIKDDMSENEVSVRRNTKRGITKRIDADRLREIRTRLEMYDAKRLTVELGLDEYSYGDMVDFKNKAILIYLVKYFGVNDILDILDFIEELENVVTYGDILMYIHKLEEEGIIKICEDGGNEFLMYTGMDHLCMPSLPEYVNVLVREIREMRYDMLIKEYEDMKSSRITCCDRFKLIRKEVMNRREMFIREYMTSTSESIVATCNRVYFNPKIVDEEVLSIALDLICIFEE